jgi:gliding motility-associated-like protein
MPKSLAFILALTWTLTSNGQLTARFSADKTAGCGPLLVHFINQTTGASAIAGYQWDLGNGNRTTIADPVAIYSQPGSYMVTLTVQNGSQTSTFSQVITIYQQPTAAFTASATQVCSPTPVQFTSTSMAGSDAITGYLWDFGDGTTVSGAKAAISHSYESAGVRGVSLTVTDTNGCTSTKAVAALLTILPRLQAGFTEDNQVLCTVGSPVQFTNTTIGPGTLTYTWNFGDGGSSTQVNPSHTYPSKGTYSVVLAVTSSVGCAAADTQTNVLNVANFQAGFMLSQPVCLGTPTTFTDQSTTAPTSRQWTIDGVVVPTPTSYSFLTSGVHSVTLTDHFQTCQVTVTKTVTVATPPVIPPFDAVPQGKCGAPEGVTVTDHTPGAVKWDWVPGYSPSYANQDTLFGGPSNLIRYYWNGPYAVQLTVTDAAGCSASVVQVLSVQPPAYETIETDGGPDASCAKQLTKSYAMAQPALITAVTWYFGDGTSSTSPTPTHTFNTSGTFFPFCAWTDINGCTGESNMARIAITPMMDMAFSTNDTVVCVGQNILFTVPGLVQNQNVLSTWDFGDGAGMAGGGSMVDKEYSQPGVYSVTLQGTDMANCKVSVTRTNYITVLPGPLVSLKETNTCLGTRGDVTFAVQVTGADSLAWNFGDGTLLTTDSTVTTLVHTYTRNGNYPATVAATNGHCTQTAGAMAVVQLKPVLNLTLPPAVCPNDGITANVVASTGSVDTTFYSWLLWDFQYGDGTPYQGYNGPISYNYQVQAFQYALFGFAPGESNIRLIITDMNACRDTSNFAPLVIGGVIPGIDVLQDDQCYRQPVLLMDTSKVARGDSVVSWKWDFGDGATLSQSGTVNHLYAHPGLYTVRLTVQDASGCTSAAATQAQVTVNGPEAAFTVPGTVLPNGSTVQFNNISNTYGTTNVNWFWQFGDGSTSSAFDPSYTYGVPGTYVVTLTAMDAAGGCSSVAKATLTIQDLNTAFGKTLSYVSQGSCPPLLVQFTSYATNYTSISWDFGDGDMASNVANPGHVYAHPGKYIVTFTVTEPNGNQLTTTDSVVVVAPEASLTTASPAICAGQTDTLRSTDRHGVATYNWDFGDGTVFSGVDSTVSHVYAIAGTYDDRLVVTDSLGCSVAAASSDAIDVHAPPIVSLTPSAPLVCLGKGMTIKATGGVTYNWSPGASLSDSTVSAPVATPGINTRYTVGVSDDIGCITTDSITVQVVIPDTVRVSPDSVAICPGSEVPIKAIGAYSYQWISTVDGLSGTTIPDPVATPASTTVYKVVGSDSANCFQDTASVIVALLDRPSVDAGPDIVVQAETPVTIPAMGSPDIVFWQWTPATWLSCAACEQPVCTPRQTQQYIVTVTAADGCSASDTIVVQLACNEARVRIPDAFTPNGDGHNDRFTVLGAIPLVDHLVVYDRWGERVFEANNFAPADPNAGWNGMVHGQLAPAGVYVYYVEMHCPSGGLFSRRGTVVLVR